MIHVGFCNMPMWRDGLPAGYCDENAFGPSSNNWKGTPLVWACVKHGGPPKCEETEIIRQGMMKKENQGAGK